jgi:hypothetical protein
LLVRGLAHHDPVISLRMPAAAVRVRRFREDVSMMTVRTLAIAMASAALVSLGCANRAADAGGLPPPTQLGQPPGRRAADCAGPGSDVYDSNAPSARAAERFAGGRSGSGCAGATGRAGRSPPRDVASERRR